MEYLPMPRTRCFFYLAAITCLAACSDHSPEQQAQTPQAAPAERNPLTGEQLGNLSYPSELGPNGRVQLQHGVFEQQDPTDATAHVKVKLTEHIAQGDLNGDGRQDAVVILETESGGSGTFMDLAAVLNSASGPRVVAVTDLGDRTEIRSLTIDNSIARVDLIGHGPEDPVCCPTQVQQREYRFDNNRWIAPQRTAMP